MTAEKYDFGAMYAAKLSYKDSVVSVFAYTQFILCNCACRCFPQCFSLYQYLIYMKINFELSKKTCAYDLFSEIFPIQIVRQSFFK